MGLQFILRLAEGIRWDVAITFLLAFILETTLIINRSIKNKGLTKKKEILVWQDILFSFATAATIYGGFSAIYFAIKGKLLFNQSMIVSEEYIILFAGVVLLALGLLTFKKALKEAKGLENEKD